MQTLGYALFDTPVGHCGIAWSTRGLTGVQLPGTTEADTRARMQRSFPHSPECGPEDSTLPQSVRDAIAAVVALLRGAPREPADLSDIVLDQDGVPGFHQRVYALARAIPPGQTLTYGEVAKALGDPGTARAVGQALGANPFAPVVPCHRILAAGGRSGGFSAPGGTRAKLRLLEIEGTQFGGPGLFDAV